MSLDNKVVWSEGMFLNPHHFQQQERYFERYIDGKHSTQSSYGWGIEHIEVDRTLLKLGKLSIASAAGVFPDGTPFSFPDQHDSPPVFEVPENTLDKIVYLAIPVTRPGAVDILAEDESQGLARYYSHNQEVRDVSIEGGDSVKVSVGKLRFRLLLESDDMSGYACIGILKITEAKADKDVVLDNEYIPTCMNCDASQRLSAFLSELAGLIQHRGDAIAARLADIQRGGTAEISDYMLLQLINRIEPLTVHLSSMKGLHPIQLYAEAIQISGELATFSTKEKRPPRFPAYLHDDLLATFSPVMNALRQSMSMVQEQTAAALTLVEKKFGIHVAQIPDPSLLHSALFVLAVRADVAESAIRKHFPAQVKVGPVDHIRDMVNSAMPGIPLKPMPVAPRQIPYHAGFTYFELERNNPYWKALENAGGIALHIGGDFPGLDLELWTIRQ